MSSDKTCFLFAFEQSFHVFPFEACLKMCQAAALFDQHRVSEQHWLQQWLVVSRSVAPQYSFASMNHWILRNLYNWASIAMLMVPDSAKTKTLTRPQVPDASLMWQSWIAVGTRTFHDLSKIFKLLPVLQFLQFLEDGSGFDMVRPSSFENTAM